jgi:hypothetical protein
MQRKMHNLAAALSFALAGTAAQAADWELNPRVEAGYMVDDNYRLANPGAEIEVQGPLADAQLEFRARMPQSEFSFTPRVRATYFPDHQDLDTVDYFGLLDWQHHGQRFETRVRGDYSQQDVVNSEQPDASIPTDSGLGDPDIGDSGRVLVENRRSRGALRPTLSYEMSERRSLEFGANFVNVDYEKEIFGSQVDYRSGDVSVGLVTRMTPISSLTARLRASRYDIDFQGESTSYGAEVEWDTHTATEIETFVRLGAQSVEYENGFKQTAWLAGGGVNMPVGRNTLFADLTRGVGPSSAGIIITRDQLRLRWQRDFTPRLALLLGVRGTHDDSFVEDGLYRPRSYATGDVGLLWRWREEFSFQAAYAYTWQKFDDAFQNTAATSNGASVTVLYQPLQRRR